MVQRPTLPLCLEEGEKLLDRAVVFANYLAVLAEDADIRNEGEPVEVEKSTCWWRSGAQTRPHVIRSFGPLFRHSVSSLAGCVREACWKFQLEKSTPG